MYTCAAKNVAAYIPSTNIHSGIGLLMAFTFPLVFLYSDLGGGHKKISKVINEMIQSMKTVFKIFGGSTFTWFVSF